MRWQGGCRAYGGGRTIRQGEALESEEVAQTRKQRIAEALSRYKQTSGTIVDSSVEAAAQVSHEIWCLTASAEVRGRLLVLNALEFWACSSGWS